ncbi:MAG: lysoplasmalogenase [Clostridium sp.]|uniref:lysoplasmalogenase n=1 Tax=Clostridium sp. TaxID=1506 RepID=UPI002A865274|nr:lysoplasmalogenase [Clostridium sp.]MDY5099293.1 lysoplasmalogenase [Clostridium sp.]
MIPYIVTGISVVIISIFIYINLKITPKQRTITKAIASLSFLAVGITSFIYGTGDKTYGYMLLLGLILGVLGDIGLGLKRVFKKTAHICFILGTIAFLLGHVAYISLFVMMAPITLGDVLMAAALALGFIVVGNKAHINYRYMRPIAYMYMATIAFMVIKAVSLLPLLGMTTSNIMVALGAVLFVISDMILAFLYFGGKKQTYLKTINLITYYGGQLLIALSILYKI